MLEIIIDSYGDFMESSDYKPDGKSTAWIINLEQFVIDKMKYLGTKEISIKFIMEDSNESNS